MIFMRKLSVLTSILLLSVGLLAQTGTPNNEPTTPVKTVVMTANGTVTSTSFVTFTTTTLPLPLIPPSTARKGNCDIIFQTSANTVTPTFAFNTNNSLTGLTILGSHYYQSTSAVTNFLPPANITTATSSAFTAALTVVAGSTTYQVHVDFVVFTNTNPQQITVYAKVNSGTLTIVGGSACSLEP